MSLLHGELPKSGTKVDEGFVRILEVSLKCFRQELPCLSDLGNEPTLEEIHAKCQQIFGNSPEFSLRSMSLFAKEGDLRLRVSVQSLNKGMNGRYLVEAWKVCGTGVCSPWSLKFYFNVPSDVRLAFVSGPNGPKFNRNMLPAKLDPLADLAVDQGKKHQINIPSCLCFAGI